MLFNFEENRLSTTFILMIINILCNLKAKRHLQENLQLLKKSIQIQK